MKRRIISVFVILILALSVVLPAASATPAAKIAYKEVFPNALDPAPNEGKGDCTGLCHISNPKQGQSNLTNYGKKLNETAMKDYKERFKNLTVEQKKDVLKKIREGITPVPVPEYPSVILPAGAIMGLILFVQHRKRKM